MIVMGMAGIYRGLIEDATLLVERIGADLWVVQRDTRGPFAEVSRVPKTLVYRVLAVPGVESAREFVFHTIQRQHNGKPLRMSVLGLSWPLDKGEWLPLIAGRPLAQNHYEMVADKTLGFRLHERIKLGKETYTIVGITSGMVSSGGDGNGLRHRLGLAGDSVRYAGRGHSPGTRGAGSPQPDERGLSQSTCTHGAAFSPRRRTARCRLARTQRRGGSGCSRRGPGRGGGHHFHLGRRVGLHAGRPGGSAGAGDGRQGPQAVGHVSRAADDHRGHHHGPDSLHA